MLRDNAPALGRPGVEQLAEAPGVPCHEAAEAVVVGDPGVAPEHEGLSRGAGGGGAVLEDTRRLEALRTILVVVPGDGREADGCHDEAADPLGVGRRDLVDRERLLEETVPQPVTGGLDVPTARDGPRHAGTVAAGVERDVLEGRDVAPDEHPAPRLGVPVPPLQLDLTRRRVEIGEQRVDHRHALRRDGERELGVVDPVGETRGRGDREPAPAGSREVATAKSADEACDGVHLPEEPAVARPLRLLPEDAGGTGTPGGTIPSPGRGLGVQHQHRLLPRGGVDDNQRPGECRGAEEARKDQAQDLHGFSVHYFDWRTHQ